MQKLSFIDLEIYGIMASANALRISTINVMFDFFISNPPFKNGCNPVYYNNFIKLHGHIFVHAVNNFKKCNEIVGIPMFVAF